MASKVLLSNSISLIKYTEQNWKRYTTIIYIL